MILSVLSSKIKGKTEGTIKNKVMCYFMIVIVSKCIMDFGSELRRNVSKLRICRILNSLVIGSTVAYLLMNYPIKLRQRVGVTQAEQNPFEVGKSSLNDLRLFSQFTDPNTLSPVLFRENLLY